MPVWGDTAVNFCPLRPAPDACKTRKEQTYHQPIYGAPHRTLPPIMTLDLPRLGFLNRPKAGRRTTSRKCTLFGTFVNCAISCTVNLPGGARAASSPGNAC